MDEIIEQLVSINKLKLCVAILLCNPATQITCLQAENLTPYKYFISLITKNKLYKSHSNHEGYVANGMHLQGECSANIPIYMSQSAGAKHDWAYESLELHKKGLGVRYITTNADLGTYDAVLKLYSKVNWKKV
ncbi:hypothetical protein KUTeg_000609 [Tegillarca granosa]|uniref:Uncharacterized protein n=1 Tax=Tegillarca granosa TaxID=220873 RepID=A0ABQ9G2D3_TEGGR|nr:hypothetical protein KUTeg_000609 [Tegillarca granosa]